MIEGHGDDSYKFERPITANFSSNVYNRVDLSGLQAHLCSCISGISSYPSSGREVSPYCCLCLCDEWCYRSYLSYSTNFSWY